MNKIKKIWRENKVLLVLAIILIICLIIIAVVAITSFYGSSSNVYGNRLDVTEGIKIDKNLTSSVETALEGVESVSDASVKLKLLTFHIAITFNDGTNMDDAKKVAESIVNLFSEEILGVYDLEFTIKTNSTENGGFVLKGARNASGSGTVVWGNYNISDTETNSNEE